MKNALLLTFLTLTSIANSVAAAGFQDDCRSEETTWYRAVQSDHELSVLYDKYIEMLATRHEKRRVANLAIKVMENGYDDYLQLDPLAAQQLGTKSVAEMREYLQQKKEEINDQINSQMNTDVYLEVALLDDEEEIKRRLREFYKRELGVILDERDEIGSRQCEDHEQETNDTESTSE